MLPMLVISDRPVNYTPFELSVLQPSDTEARSQYYDFLSLKHIALRKAKTLWRFGLSDCIRVKMRQHMSFSLTGIIEREPEKGDL